MQTKIKDDKLLQEISRRVNKDPETIVNEFVESLDFLPNSILKECSDASFKDLLIHYFYDALSGRKLNKDLRQILGGYRYYVYELESDLRSMDFNFIIRFKPNEKRINIDEIGLTINPIHIEMIVHRNVEGVKLHSRTVEIIDGIEVAEYLELRNLEEELGKKIRDPVVWHDFINDAEPDKARIREILLDADTLTDSTVTITLRFKEENLDRLPKLKAVNKVLDFAEKMVRDSLR